jgi:hypothetical protein
LQKSEDFLIDFLSLRSVTTRDWENGIYNLYTIVVLKLKMNKRKTIIQGMQNIQLKYLSMVLIVCFALNAFFRKDLTGRNEILDIILGSLPNFIAVLVIAIVFSDQQKVVGIYKYIIILTITSLLVLEEYFLTFTGNKIFDHYDI